MRFLNVLLVILVLGLFSSCQDSDDPVRTTPTIPGEGTWSTLTMQNTGTNGLPDNHVLDISFSPDGNAVIATPYAITFNNGTNWESKSYSQLNLGRYFEAYNLYTDRNGTVWIAHSEGIGKLIDGEVIDITELQEVFDDYMYMDRWSRAFEDSNGTLWFSGITCIISFDGNEWIFHDVDGDEDFNYECQFAFIDLEGRTAVCDHDLNFHYWDGTQWVDMDPIVEYDFTNVNEVFYDSNGILYLLDTERGYKMMDNGTLSYFSPNFHEYYYQLGRVSILEDDEGTIWVCDGRQVTKRPPGERYFTTVFNESRNINEMVLAPDGKIWLATVGGLCIFDGNTWAYIDADGLPENIHNFVCVDDEGAVCLANVNGIFRKNGNDWEKVNTSPQYGINDMLADSDGNIWIIREDKLIRFNKNGDYQIYPELGGDALYLSPNGDFYIGTPNGLYQYENGNMTLIMDHYVHCITEYQGEILIGANFILNTNIGLFPYFHDNSNYSLPVSGLNYSNYANKIFPDLEGNLWCTSIGGISKYDGEKWITYSSNESGIREFEFNPYGTFKIEVEHTEIPIPGNCNWPVIDHFPSVVDFDGNIWFGFQKEIVVYDGKNFSVMEPDIEVGSYIWDMDLMPNGDIWFTTEENGIVVYKP